MKRLRRIRTEELSEEVVDKSYTKVIQRLPLITWRDRRLILRLIILLNYFSM